MDPIDPAQECGRCHEGPRPGERLRQCSSCKIIWYCSRDCQVADWKDKTPGGHRTMCKVIQAQRVARENNAKRTDQQESRRVLVGGDTEAGVQGATFDCDGAGMDFGNASKEVLMESERMARKARKQAKKSGAPMFYMPMFTITPEVGERFTRDQLTERLIILHKAHNDFAGHRHQLSNLKHERVYTELYNDILEHEDQWFGIFSSDDNNVYPERCVGILGTLATIHRQRGEIQKTEEILALDEQILNRYIDMTSRTDSPAQHNCCRGLQYKYWIIRFNLLMMKDEIEAAVAYFRRVCTYELEEGYDHERQNFAWIISAALLRSGRNPESLTIASLKKMTDTELTKILKNFRKQAQMHESEQQNPHGDLDCDLRACAGCQTKEAMLGDFNFCAGCKKVVYCSVACQKKDWPTHKVECKKHRGKKK